MNSTLFFLFFKVWQAQQGHKQAVRDLTCSPLVPYWFASCSKSDFIVWMSFSCFDFSLTTGDDGCCNIWDVRFGNLPVRSLELHTNAIARVISLHSFAFLHFAI